jgi:hypothetical protein
MRGPDDDFEDDFGDEENVKMPPHQEAGGIPDAS